MATSVLQQIDGQLDKLFAGWNVWSTCIAAVLIVYLFSPLFFASEADTHPLLLARQAMPSAVRQPGESAVYRSLEVPHGYPLRSGLDVKDAGNPRWAPGRDGDLRDIWKEAMRRADPPVTTEGRFISIKGIDDPDKHDMETLSTDINIIGKYLQSQGGKRVVIYLPNSIQFVIALFAAAFYGITPVLISQGQPAHLLSELLGNTKADILIAPAGIIAPDDIKQAIPKLNHIIWVVEQGSRELEWSEGPPTGGNVSEWHRIIEQGKESASPELPSTNFENGAPAIVSVWQGRDPKNYEIVEFSHQNIVAGVAAQLNALPRTHRLSASDVFLPLEPLTLSYPLILFLAALHSHATIALTAATSHTPDFALAFQRVKPSVVVASPETLSNEHARLVTASVGILEGVRYVQRTSALATGSMHFANPPLPAPHSSPTTATTAIRGPRLIYTSARAGADSTPIGPAELTTLRVHTGARIIHALTSARVAGAVAQSSMLDYRMGPAASRAHYGPPVSALELKLIEGLGEKIRDDLGEEEPVGVIVALGPAAVGGEANLGVRGKFGDDNCLVLV